MLLNSRNSHFRLTFKGFLPKNTCQTCWKWFLSLYYNNLLEYVKIEAFFLLIVVFVKFQKFSFSFTILRFWPKNTCQTFWKWYLLKIFIRYWMYNIFTSKIHFRHFENGIWVRPFGKLVYIMPPYIITDDELVTLCQSLLTVVTAYLGQIPTTDRVPLWACYSSLVSIPISAKPMPQVCLQKP